MKFLAVLFSLYILGLTLVPCEDEAESHTDSAEFHQFENTHHSDSMSDDCSPFCHCNCCHVHITNFENEETDLIDLTISTQISDSKYDLGDGISPSYFQPPRV